MPAIRSFRIRAVNSSGSLPSAGYPVIPVSGSNAALNALVASGLETSHFLFYGFLDAKSVRRKKELESLKSLPYTVIFYEAPHRIEKMRGRRKGSLWRPADLSGQRTDQVCTKSSCAARFPKFSRWFPS